MKWEELIAEARAAGVLKFCADGVAVLHQTPTDAAPKEEQSSERIPGQDRGEGRQGGHGKSESAD